MTAIVTVIIKLITTTITTRPETDQACAVLLLPNNTQATPRK